MQNDTAEKHSLPTRFILGPDKCFLEGYEWLKIHLVIGGSFSVWSRISDLLDLIELFTAYKLALVLSRMSVSVLRLFSGSCQTIDLRRRTKCSKDKMAHLNLI